MLPAQVLNTTISIKRRVVTVDDIGDISEVFSVIASGVSASLQKRSVEDAQSVDKSGAMFPASHVCYFNEPGVTPASKDQILDADGSVFEILSVLKLKSPDQEYYYKTDISINETPS